MYLRNFTVLAMDTLQVGTHKAMTTLIKLLYYSMLDKLAFRAHNCLLFLNLGQGEHALTQLCTVYMCMGDELKWTHLLL
jgi:hypothetical protein